jgi:type VI secretion system protein ImpH
MAADGGREAPSLEAQLFDPIGGRLFDFFQAVAVLEAIEHAAGRASAGVGEGGEPAEEPVRFASSVRLSFAPTDVAGVERSASGQPAMTVNFMGLAGAHGPLPGPFAETVLRSAVTGDTAARDFLDIFNHRLVSLVYRVRRHHRIALGVAEPVDDDAARYLFALMGLGAPTLRRRLLPVQDRALLFYAGLLSREVRPLSGLAAMLECQLGVPVEGEPLVGGTFPIEPSHRTVIGPSGRNRRLGRDAVLGARYWDPSACVEIRVGPLDVADYLRLVPGTGDVPAGDRLAPLVMLVRFYAGAAIDLRLRLVLDPEAARRRGARRPGEVLRRRAASPAEGRVQTLGERPRLGYTAWVGRAFMRREVVIEGAALQAVAGEASGG